MGVKIISERKVTEEKEDAVMPLILQLRKLAKGQPGFNSEETWRHLEHPVNFLIVREWDSEEDWYNWHSSQQRIEIQEKIEEILGEKTTYSPYEMIHRIEK